MVHVVITIIHTVLSGQIPHMLKLLTSDRGSAADEAEEEAEASPVIEVPFEGQHICEVLHVLNHICLGTLWQSAVLFFIGLPAYLTGDTMLHYKILDRFQSILAPSSSFLQYI